jgi:hypothetical protein
MSIHPAHERAPPVISVHPAHERGMRLRSMHDLTGPAARAGSRMAWRGPMGRAPVDFVHPTNGPDAQTCPRSRWPSRSCIQ